MIQFENVIFSPNNKVVLGPISIQLSEHRIGVVGRNGSGKSSFLRMAAGLIDPSQGQVTVSDIDVAKDRLGALDVIGIIFQNPDHQIIFPTVSEEVAFGLQQQGHSKDAAMLAANKVLSDHGCADWGDRHTHTLSQGQRHLVCLISVLAMKPATILLDEPYAGLDIPTAARLHRKLANVEQQVILVTHDPKVLTGFDRVIWIENGEVHADGSAKDVLADFENYMTELGALDVDP
jgi:biotin transport system ATP-binding protein